MAPLMPERQHADGYCTSPQSRQRLTDQCPECGHLAALHIGVDQCPVCEMLALNRQLARIVEGGPHQALMRAGLIAGGPYGHVRR